MSDIVPFTFPDTGNRVRVKWIDGEPWWVAIDVCRELGIQNARRAITEQLDAEDVRSTYVIDARQRSRDTYVVNESGLYQLIFMSRKPQAKAFKRWVTKQVLPALRKHGHYEDPEQRKQEVLRVAGQITPEFRSI